MNIYEQALEKHKEWCGKIEVAAKAKVENKDDLSLAYTPGVAEPCRQIAADKEKVYDYTWKGNSVAVVSDGTAVLGLGDIGPEAAMPVMEGKALLFKEFAGIDAVPLCLDTKDPEEIIKIVKAIAPTFGGINLEDISAPRCVQIERTLIEELDIPVFHDDQHGTAIVVISALINALKLVEKNAEDIRVVVSGTGAAGSSIIKMLHKFGVRDILAFNVNGVLGSATPHNSSSFLDEELVAITNPNGFDGTLKDAFVGADVFVGVSAPKIVSKEMVASMAPKSIVFPMANPESEISYEDAIAAGAYIVGTGRSDHPNQINNVLAFPGLFKGALDSKATKITEDMKIAAARGIASLVAEKDLAQDYIIASSFDPRVAEVVAVAVADEAVKSGLIRGK
ncbi:MAG: NAD-dependent malic enzyme [Lactobacillales bacterium]|nr:NAD-dependent malic enzyme [Lactobacillales bacterium]